MRNFFLVLVAGFLLFITDLYVFETIKTVVQHSEITIQNLVFGIFWGWLALTLITLALIFSGRKPGTRVKTYLVTVLFIVFASKLVILVFQLLEDVWRFIQGLVHAFTASAEIFPLMPRNQVWGILALIAAAVLFSAFIYGIVLGAFNYQVKRIVLHFPNLPAAFQGFKIVQITDLHVGSFASKKPLLKAVKLINEQQPDVIFFTGDLVNNVSDEVQPYIPVLGKLSGKMGVYSVLGNHDYGDYVRWPSALNKIENLERLKQAHARMGWRLLLNEHVALERDGAKIAVLGVENWGNRAGFPKYGKLYKAHLGTENISFKMLLSHDPSHWDGEVNQKFTDIDLMLSGHTHGMQFGINLPKLRWSPVQYVYKQWAGLYKKGNQFLYVNVGLGFLGYPGRVGFLPEITVFELKRA